jgi:uncharacterized caspase-like protein
MGRHSKWRSGKAGALLAAVVTVMCAMASASFAQPAETRVALVIGNSAYQSAGALDNPQRDAKLMAERLKTAGFTVTLLVDADQQAMKRAMVDFGRELRSSEAVGLFYYAGHGLQVNGLNYLVPVNANIKDETEVGIETVGLADFLATMERAKSRINIVVLDACRNNPFSSNFRTESAGLARVDAPAGTYVAYATSPGSVASDGAGRNSPYTKALAETILKPGMPIEQVFKEVRRAVQEETGGQQTPWEASSISADFAFLRGAGPTPPVSRTPSQADLAREKELELAFWNSIKESSNTALFRSYLQQYPRGTFVPIARVRIEEIEKKDAQLKAPPVTPGQQGQGAAAGSGRGPAPVFADSGRRNLQEGELTRLSCEQLWLARNEMFARNGYCFGTSAAQQVFGTRGCTTSRQDILSAVEIQNMRLIKGVEDRKACGAITTAAFAPAGRSVAQPQQTGGPWHYVTGLDPKGDNFLALKVAPDVRSERIAKMGPDTPLKILGARGDWRQVQLKDGRTGWAHSRYIKCCREQ